MPLLKGSVQKRSEKGLASGYASLGIDGKVPTGQLPSGGGSNAAWGGITGDIGDQTDLAMTLAAKADIAHIHDIVNISNLQPELDSKASTSHNHALSALNVPVASVNFAQQQATAFRIENRTSDPIAPAVGEIWLRTDLP